jgi:hypothetical protein
MIISVQQKVGFHGCSIDDFRFSDWWHQLFSHSWLLFSNNDSLLRLIQLFVPPAEVILPWVASPTLGIVSLISLGMMLGGAALTE